ncbi:F-box family protein, partial [Trifolium medium]|nr:F-box family protein [Trifolium medium]
PAPSKVSGFVWQLLHGRVPTRNNLVTRQILDVDGDVSCALCGEAMETELHLFLYCEIAQLVWMEIFDWLGVLFSLPHNLFSIFHCLMGAVFSKCRK